MATLDELWRAQTNPFPLGQRTPTPLEQRVAPMGGVTSGASTTGGFGDVLGGASSTATSRPSVSPSVMAGLQNRAYQPTPEWLGQGGLPRSAAQMEQDLGARSFLDAIHQQRVGEIQNDAESNLLPIERALKRTQMEEAQAGIQRPQRIVKGANGTYTNEVSPFTQNQQAELGVAQGKSNIVRALEERDMQSLADFEGQVDNELRQKIAQMRTDPRFMALDARGQKDAIDAAGAEAEAAKEANRNRYGLVKGKINYGMKAPTGYPSVP